MTLYDHSSANCDWQLTMNKESLALNFLPKNKFVFPLQAKRREVGGWIDTDVVNI